MNNGRRVVITGLGVISPVGNDIATFWDSLKSGRCGIGPLTGMDLHGLPIHVAGNIKAFNPSDFGLSSADKSKNDLYSPPSQPHRRS